MTQDGFSRLLFPAEPRNFPLRRGLRMALRTLHIFSVGVMSGGILFQQPMELVQPWLLSAVFSGLALFATDMHATLAVLFEVRGFAVYAKIGLMHLISRFPEQALPLLALAMLIGTFSSHMSRQYRHRLLFFGDKIKPDQRRG